MSKVPHNDDTQDDSVPTYYLVDESTGRIRFTAAGKQAFRRRFARAGITFESIRTHAQLSAALEASTAEFLEDTIETISGMDGDPKVKALLVDILSGRNKGPGEPEKG